MSTGMNFYKLAMYIACFYDEDWFIGNIVECSTELNNVLVKFMKQSAEKNSWPQVDDKCWLPLSHIIGVLHSLEVGNNATLTYNLSDVQFCDVVNIWEDSRNQNKIRFLSYY